MKNIFSPTHYMHTFDRMALPKPDQKKRCSIFTHGKAGKRKSKKPIPPTLSYKDSGTLHRCLAFVFYPFLLWLRMSHPLLLTSTGPPPAIYPPLVRV